MAGLVAHVRAGRIAAGSRVLFVHTGGLPGDLRLRDRLGSWLSDAPWAPRADDPKGLGHRRRVALSAAALASSRTHSRNALTSGRCREAVVVMRQQRSGRLRLAIEDRDQRSVLQLSRDQHRATDGGADAVHSAWTNML